MRLTLSLTLLAFSVSLCSAEVRSRQTGGGAVAARAARTAAKAAAQAQARDFGTINPAPQPAYNLQKAQSYRHEPAAAAAGEKPARSIQEEFLEKQDKPRKERSAQPRADRVVLHGPIGEAGQPNAVIVEDGAEASAAAAAAATGGSHNRDQGGKPADPNAKSKGKGKGSS